MTATPPDETSQPPVARDLITVLLLVHLAVVAVSASWAAASWMLTGEWPASVAVALFAAVLAATLAGMYARWFAFTFLGILTLALVWMVTDPAGWSVSAAAESFWFAVLVVLSTRRLEPSLARPASVRSSPRTIRLSERQAPVSR